MSENAIMLVCAAAMALSGLVGCSQDLPLTEERAPSAATTPGEDWSYRDVYNYALERGGAEDPIAALVAEHVEQSDAIAWDDMYQGDINLDGAVLTVDETAHGRAVRASKPGDWGTITAYPYASHLGACRDHIFFTWKNTNAVCHTFVTCGTAGCRRLRMSDIQSNTSFRGISMWQNKIDCTGTNEYWTDATHPICARVEGGFNSFHPYW